MARFWDGMNEKQQLNAGDYFMVGNPETDMPEVVKYSDLIGSIKNANIPDGAILIQTNGKIADSGWGIVGNMLTRNGFEVIRAGINGGGYYGNTGIGGMAVYKENEQKVVHISPIGGILHIGKKDSDSVLSNIEMGFRVAGDVIKTYRNSTANGTYYKIACDPTYGQNKQVHLGWHAYNTNVGYKSKNVTIGREANIVMVGVNNLISEFGTHTAVTTFGLNSGNVVVGGNNDSQGAPQIVQIVRGGTDSVSSRYNYKVFEATNQNTKIAGSGYGDMELNANVLIMGSDNTRLMYQNREVFKAKPNANDFGSTQTNWTGVWGKENTRVEATGAYLHLTNLGVLNQAHLFAKKLLLGRAYASNPNLELFQFSLKELGDVLKAEYINYNWYYYLGSDRRQNVNSRFMKVRVGEYSNDIEIGSNARHAYLGHAADNTYIRGANIYLGNNLPSATLTDSFYFVMIDGNNKAHRITKQAIKDWLGIA